MEIKNIKLVDTEVALVIDDFEGDKKLFFSKVGGSDFGYIKSYELDSKFHFQYLGISFINFNAEHFISFFSCIDSFSLAKGDYIIILFENEIKLSFPFQSSPSGDKNSHRNNCRLTLEELKIFATKKMIKWKLINKRKNLYTIGGYMDKKRDAIYITKNEANVLMKIMVFKYIEGCQKLFSDKRMFSNEEETWIKKIIF